MTNDGDGHRQRRVCIKYTPAPGECERLSRALRIVLGAAARCATEQEDNDNGKRACESPEGGLIDDGEGGSCE